MTNPLAGKLVLGISSRALFDLDEANEIFERDGLDAYRDHQHEHERDVLTPGTAFPLVRGLLAINRRVGEPLVEVIVLSRNDADSAMRVFRSIEAHGLSITRGVFRGGRDPWPFLPILHCNLFLTAEPEQVLRAREQHVPAALIMRPPTAQIEEESEVRIAFDGDAVLFDAESQGIYDREGIDAFRAFEAAHADEPMLRGPFQPFLEGLARVQAHFKEGPSPIRTALVTARDAPAHYRVVNTLRSWGVRVDETYFLGGVEKTEILAAFGAHIFFDDQLTHVALASSRVPSAQVLWPPEELGPTGKAPGQRNPGGATSGGRRKRRPAPEALPAMARVRAPTGSRVRDTEAGTPDESKNESAVRSTEAVTVPS